MDRDFQSLIITGDDFGRSPEINAAIERYHRAGVLTQASLMVNEPAVEDALRIAHRNPDLRVGLHLTLCDGFASQLSPITTPERRFSRSPTVAGLRYALCPWLHRHLRIEIARQFARFTDLGFTPTYWDGHTHLHLHPTILQLTIPIAKRAGFRMVRLVREPGAPGLIPWIFRRLSESAIPALREAGISFADHVHGLRDTGRVSMETFRRALDESDDSLTEIYLHPGAEKPEPDPHEIADFLRNHPRRSALKLLGAMLAIGLSSV